MFTFFYSAYKRKSYRGKEEVKKTVCPAGYYRSANSPMANQELGDMMYGLHRVPKCMSCHKAIDRLVITGRAHCLSF